MTALATLHKTAKRWLKALRDGDAAALARYRRAYPNAPDRLTLRAVQHALALERGYENWLSLKNATADRTHDATELTFLESACWDHHTHGKQEHRMYDRAAQRLLAQDSSIARASLATAVVCGDLAEVERMLASRPNAARERCGARGWTPILYLAYTRFTHGPTIDRALALARLLLDHGADPNDFYMAGDARYSVLVGVAGEGEQDSPRQPYAKALFDLLLERGAEPFDIQVLYDTHFSGDVLWWLELVYAHTIDTPRSAAWQDPEWRMFDMGAYGSGARFLLELAVKKHDRRLAEWALERGANPNAAPARDPRFPKLSLYELALREEAPVIAEMLVRFGGRRSVPALDDEERFRDACFRLDREGIRASLRAHPEYLTSPAVLFEAARRDRPDMLALLLDAGVPLDLQDPNGKRALHEAAAHNALGAARLLVERGAEIDPRESAYGGTPLGWASHGDHREMIEFLSHESRDIWALCFNGCVGRVREVLAADPATARVIARNGTTPLWWLPDDETQAMEIVELLLGAGVDPTAKNAEGHTAADWASRRGMTDVAKRLQATAD